jgi:hypothetical protein
MQDNKKRLPLSPTNGKVIKKSNGKVWFICHYINGQLFGYYEYHQVNGNVTKMYFGK